MTRIGTWNLAGRWGEGHAEFLTGLDCDVLLLTEVRRDVELAAYQHHLTQADMAPARAWAGVFSREPVEGRADPHPATAVARSGGVTYASSVLPWRSCGTRPPWSGPDHAARTRTTIDELRRHLEPRMVWGGDFNHALIGGEFSGSRVGRGHIEDLVRELGLQVPTSVLPHRLDGAFSIDHVAVPKDAAVRGMSRHDATGLSDHDAYVVALA